MLRTHLVDDMIHLLKQLLSSKRKENLAFCGHLSDHLVHLGAQSVSHLSVLLARLVEIFYHEGTCLQINASVSLIPRSTRRQSDFGTTYVDLRFPPDKFVRMTRRFVRTLRALRALFSLAHSRIVSGRFSATASARHEDLERAAVWTPKSRHMAAHREPVSLKPNITS